MKFVVAKRLGAGLGNEMLPWAKGWLASQVLGGQLVGPAWGLSSYKYYRHFGTNRTDFVFEELLTRLPHHSFTEDDYRETRQVDFGKSIAVWAESRELFKKSSFIVTVDGMYGGYPAIRDARPFLWATLAKSRDALKNVYEIVKDLDRRKLFVTVHYRSGDFKPMPEGELARGAYSVRISSEWYFNVCESLYNAFGGQVQFRFFTDAGGPDYEELVKHYNPSQKPQTGLTEVSDLLLQGVADLRVCSVSSYSLMGSFFSEGPYIWYEPQLVLQDGVYSLWGAEPAQSAPGGLTFENAIKARTIQPGEGLEQTLKGFPVGHDGRLPTALAGQLQTKLLAKDPTTDLLEYGAVPQWICI